MKTKIRIGLIIAAMGIIIANLIVLDYSNWTWGRNPGVPLIIISMVILIVSLINQIRHDKKRQSKLTDDGQ